MGYLVPILRLKARPTNYIIAELARGGFVRYTGGRVVWIDTEGTFRPERLKPICARFNVETDAALDNVMHCVRSVCTLARCCLPASSGRAAAGTCCRYFYVMVLTAIAHDPVPPYIALQASAEQ